MGRENELLEMDDDQAAELDLASLTYTERMALQLRHAAASEPPERDDERWVTRTVAQAAGHRTDYEARNRAHVVQQVEAQREAVNAARV